MHVEDALYFETLNVAAFALFTQTQSISLLYILVTIKCLGIVVLRLASHTGQFRLGVS